MILSKHTYLINAETPQMPDQMEKGQKKKNRKRTLFWSIFFFAHVFVFK